MERCAPIFKTYRRLCVPPSNLCVLLIIRHISHSQHLMSLHCQVNVAFTVCCCKLNEMLSGVTMADKLYCVASSWKLVWILHLVPGYDIVVADC